jgi:hypothetical protein
VEENEELAAATEETPLDQTTQCTSEQLNLASNDATPVSNDDITPVFDLNDRIDKILDSVTATNPIENASHAYDPEATDSDPGCHARILPTPTPTPTPTPIPTSVDITKEIPE